MSLARFLLGAIIGGAAGATVGLLFAPRSGEETRQMIREDVNGRYNDSVTAVRDKADEVKGQLKDSVDSVKQNVDEKVVAMREKTDEVKGQLKESAQSLKDKAQALSEELEETGRKSFKSLNDSKV